MFHDMEQRRLTNCFTSLTSTFLLTLIQTAINIRVDTKGRLTSCMFKFNSVLQVGWGEMTLTGRLWDRLKETLSKTVRHNTCETFYVWILLYRAFAPWARQCCAWFSGCDMKGDDKCAPPSLDLSHIAHFTRNYNWEWERNMLLNYR